MADVIYTCRELWCMCAVGKISKAVGMTMSMYMCGVVPSLFGCFFEFHPYYVHFCWLDQYGLTREHVVLRLIFTYSI